jgi:hypothetical protein
MMEVMFYLSKDYPDLINWGNQGEELVIFNQTEFEDKVLHVVFRHGKLESFVRQVLFNLFAAEYVWISQGVSKQKQYKLQEQILL